MYHLSIHRLSPLLCALALLWSGCGATQPAHNAGADMPAIALPYEQEDLVAVMHNEQNAYSLLVYRNPMGQLRHVVRRHGVCEMVLTYATDGRIKLKERGQLERVVDSEEALRISRYIDTLVGRNEAKEKKAAETI